MRRTLLFLLFALALCGTACVSVREARSRYAATQDYAALKRLSHRLRAGMTRTEVESLLGQPIEHPGNGQYCYLSDRSEVVGDFTVPVGLIVNYCDDAGLETGFLHSFFFVAVAE